MKVYTLVPGTGTFKTKAACQEALTTALKDPAVIAQYTVVRQRGGWAACFQQINYADPELAELLTAYKRALTDKVGKAGDPKVSSRDYWASVRAVISAEDALTAVGIENLNDINLLRVAA